MAIKTDYIWMDGSFVPTDKAVVPFLNNTLHYGIGFFEGIRAYNTPQGSAVFRLRDHVARLFESVKIGGFSSMPFSEEAIFEAIKETVRKNNLKDCYIRPLVYFQDDTMGLDISRGGLKVGIAAWEWASFFDPEKKARGLKAGISSFTRMHHNAFLVKSKAVGNYVNSVYAKSLARSQGYDEAILLDNDGYVSECTGENLFMVRKGKIWTPNLANVLDGITRDSIITILQDQGLEIKEAPIARDMLYTADEVFLCGTAAEIASISEIDNRVIGSGRMGKLTTIVEKIYSDTIRGKGVRSKEWCDLVE